MADAKMILIGSPFWIAHAIGSGLAALINLIKSAAFSSKLIFASRRVIFGASDDEPS